MPTATHGLLSISVSMWDWAAGERKKLGLNGCDRARFRFSEREATRAVDNQTRGDDGMG